MRHDTIFVACHTMHKVQFIQTIEVLCATFVVFAQYFRKKHTAGDGLDVECIAVADYSGGRKGPSVYVKKSIESWKCVAAQEEGGPLHDSGLRRSLIHHWWIDKWLLVDDGWWRHCCNDLIYLSAIKNLVVTYTIYFLFVGIQRELNNEQWTYRALSKPHLCDTISFDLNPIGQFNMMMMKFDASFVCPNDRRACKLLRTSGEYSMFPAFRFGCLHDTRPEWMEQDNLDKWRQSKRFLPIIY